MASTHFPHLLLRIAALCAVIGTAGCSKPQEEAPVVNTDQDDSRPESQQSHIEASTANRAQPESDADGSQDTTPSGKAGQSVEASGKSDGAKTAQAGKTGRMGNGKGASGADVFPGAVGNYSSSGDPDYKPPSNPRDAESAAEQALVAAEKAARSGEYGTAYRTALSGWQDANTYSKQDDKCRALAQKLLGRLKEYGEKANRAAGAVETPAPSYKTLILK